jgi:arsenical pump membrane protein
VATAVSVFVLIAVLGLVAWGRIPDAAVAVPAAVAVVALGLVSVDTALDTLDRLVPTLAFLAAILVVGEVSRVAGLFVALGAVIDRTAGDSGRRLVLAVSAAAIVVTAVMSLDATAVLFTPVVIHVVMTRGSRRTVDREPPLLVTTQLANASSGWFPVSNLTNLLVFSATGLTFGGFALRMALPTAVASAVVVGVLLTRARTAADGESTSMESDRLPHAPDESVVLDGFARLVLVALGLLVVAFFVASQLDVEPAWVAAGFAVFLGAAALVARRDRFTTLVAAASPRFLVFVAALAIVVDAAVGHGLGDAAERAIPDGASLLALLAIAVIGAVLANLVNNVPATLVLLGAVGATGAGSPARLLALLIGVNIGPNLTYTGSLATLLWRKAVRGAAVEPSHRSFYRAALLTTPPALVFATVALWCTIQVTG